MVEINVLRLTPLPSAAGARQEILQAGALLWEVTAFSKYASNLWYRCFRKRFLCRLKRIKQI